LRILIHEISYMKFSIFM